MVASNLVGPDALGNYGFGHSMIVNPIAWRLAQARGTEEIVAAKLDPDPMRYVTWGSRSLQRFDHLEDRNLKLYEEILKEARSRFNLESASPDSRRNPSRASERRWRGLWQ